MTEHEWVLLNPDPAAFAGCLDELRAA